MTPITAKRVTTECCAPAAASAEPTVKVDAKAVAQCCAKRSRSVAGCHD